MKYILITLAALTTWTANAAVYECQTNTHKYLAAMKSDMTGTLYSQELDSNFYKELVGTTTVTMPSDGGTTTIRHDANEPDVNWRLPENRVRCYVWGEASVQIQVRISSRGDRGSELTLLPNIAINPRRDSRCSIPRPLVHPQPVRCKLL